MTTGLKEAILEFFSWESLGAGSAGLRCRAGGAAAWSSELETGMSDFFRVARVEFRGIEGGNP